ncbi:MAG: MBL fold metallo-hydrolase [Acidobacteria bacterium]|nr:MBL fold metallo-hydrolase [Acidobacteriota bacterium]
MAEPLPSLSFHNKPDDYHPIPAAAYDEHSPAVMEAVMSKGYYTREISNGIHYLTEGWYFVMVAEHDDGLIVVDAPPTIGSDFLGNNLLNGIGEISDKPITHVIYSHHHRDHIGAANLYPEDAIIIAQDECAEYVATANDPQRPPATETFTDSYTLSLGGRTLQLDYHGNIHCPGNIFIYEPDEKILMNVDVIFPGWSPFSSLAMASDLRGFLRGHDVVLSYDFDTFLPGHLSRLGTRDDVEVQKAYFDDLVNATMTHLDEVSPARNAMDATISFMGVAEQVGGFENAWLVFDTYLNSIADAVTAEVLPKWQGKLAAADVYTRSHAWEVVERLRLDA